MKTCLSKDGGPPRLPRLLRQATQQQKMKTETPRRHQEPQGADRKSFMSTCLKGQSRGRSGAA